MQMIEVGMRNQHQVDGGQIGDAQAGTAQAFQHEKPAREVRIDHDALSANLHEKAGVANERDAEFAVAGEAGLVGLNATWSHHGVAYQTTKLGGAFAKGRVAKRLLDHPALINLR